MKRLILYLVLFFSLSAGGQTPPSVLRDTLRIYFELNKADLSAESKDLLDTLLKIPQLKVIRITAYTDFLGGNEKNMELSQKRSENTKAYLIEKKFPAEKITVCQGLGVHSNSSEEHRTNKQDKGIREHRLVEVVYVYEKPKPVPVAKGIDPNKAIIKEEDLVVGSNLVLENIIFYGNRSVIVPSSEGYLQQLLEIMQKYPNLKIEIQGYICCRPDGQDAFDYGQRNNQLSLNRARTIYNYLRACGIDASRMSYAGFGSSHKRFPEEKTRIEQDLNKRVEIKIIDK